MSEKIVSKSSSGSIPKWAIIAAGSAAAIGLAGLVYKLWRDFSTSSKNVDLKGVRFWMFNDQYELIKFMKTSKLEELLKAPLSEKLEILRAYLMVDMDAKSLYSEYQALFSKVQSELIPSPTAGGQMSLPPQAQQISVEYFINVLCQFNMEIIAATQKHSSEYDKKRKADGIVFSTMESITEEMIDKVDKLYEEYMTKLQVSLRQEIFQVKLQEMAQKFKVSPQEIMVGYNNSDEIDPHINAMAAYFLLFCTDTFANPSNEKYQAPRMLSTEDLFVFFQKKKEVQKKLDEHQLLKNLPPRQASIVTDIKDDILDVDYAGVNKFVIYNSIKMSLQTDQNNEKFVNAALTYIHGVYSR